MLERVKALAHRSPVVEMRERTDIAVFRITGRNLDIENAIRLGPSDWLLIDHVPPQLQQTALIQDMSSALTFIELSGQHIIDRIGLSALARENDGSLTTRLADLRVTVSYRRKPEEQVLLICDRFSADYLWEWLAARLAVPEST
jgi:hypothetical protein